MVWSWLLDAIDSVAFATVPTWRTRADPFEPVWKEVLDQIEAHPALEAKTIFQALQRSHPGEFAGGQLRNFVMTYSNWEDVTLCYLERFESLPQRM